MVRWVVCHVLVGWGVSLFGLKHLIHVSAGNIHAFLEILAYPICFAAAGLPARLGGYQVVDDGARAFLRAPACGWMGSAWVGGGGQLPSSWSTVCEMMHLDTLAWGAQGGSVCLFHFESNPCAFYVWGLPEILVRRTPLDAPKPVAWHLTRSC